MNMADAPRYDGQGLPSQDQQDVIRRMLNMNFGAVYDMTKGIGRERSW